MTHLGILTDIEALGPLLTWRGARVADVGCGAGELARALAGLGATVVGLEPDPVQAEANSRAEPCEGVTFEQAGAEALPLDDRSVDAVVFSRSLHHVPAALMDQALGEARRVLADDGALLVIEPSIYGQFSALLAPFHDEALVRGEALAALERARETFASVEELWFTHEARFPSFDAFESALLCRTHTLFRAEQIEGDEVRAAFEAGRVDEGYRFTNPMLVRLHRGPQR